MENSKKEIIIENGITKKFRFSGVYEVEDTMEDTIFLKDVEHKILDKSIGTIQLNKGRTCEGLGEQKEHKVSLQKKDKIKVIIQKV